jgi:5,10-methylenetetrahydrofolate reductase
MRLGSLAASVYLQQNGIEPIYQITCRDRNRIALQSDLLSASSLGIENVLCLTGDHIKLGDHREAKAVFDIDSVQLLAIADGLNKGYDLSRHPLSASTDLCLGAVVNPNFDPLGLQLIKMEKKIKAGAEFFQTQAVYDLNILESCFEKTRPLGAPGEFGIVVIKSPEMAPYMNEHVSGIHIPESFVKEIGSVPPEGRREKVVEMTARLVNQIAPMVQGIHFMPVGWSDVVPDIVSKIVT